MMFGVSTGIERRLVNLTYCDRKTGFWMGGKAEIGMGRTSEQNPDGPCQSLPGKYIRKESRRSYNR